MSNYNKVLLMGRLTRDPELRYTPQGVPVTEIGVAVNREFMVGTERRKDTTFVDVTLWRRQAEVVCQYLKKGAPIFIEGYLSLDTWEAQDGQKRQRLRVIADHFQFMGGKPEGEGSRGGYSAAEEGAAGDGGYGGGAANRPQSSPQATQRAPLRGPAGPAGGGGSRIPQEAFSPLPGDERDEHPARRSKPGSGGQEPEGRPLGVEDSEIPF